MNAVADLFDRNNSGLIDWEEFIAALRPDWVERKDTDAEKIHDEVKRLVMLCTCRQKFKVFQVGEGKYRVSFCELFSFELIRNRFEVAPEYLKYCISYLFRGKSCWLIFDKSFEIHRFFLYIIYSVSYFRNRKGRATIKVMKFFDKNLTSN